MKNNNAQAGFSILIIVIFIFFLGAIGVVTWYATQARYNSSQHSSSSSSVPPTPASNKGTITGATSYPAERLPDDEEVCAVLIKDESKTYCTKVNHQPTYSLTVPAGAYYVFAQTAGWPNYRAYYNEFVTCGLSVNCPASGHVNILAVTVSPGKTTDKIDPADWYNLH